MLLHERLVGDVVVRVFDLQVVADASRSSDLDVGVLAQEDALIEVADVENVQLVLLVHRFATEKDKKINEIKREWVTVIARLRFLQTDLELSRLENAHHVLCLALKSLQTSNNTNIKR